MFGTGRDDGEKFEAETSAPNGEMVAIFIGGLCQLVEHLARFSVERIGQTGTAARHQETVESIKVNLQFN